MGDVFSHLIVSWQNLVFLQTLFLENERSANQPKKLRNDAFQVKTTQSAKN